MRARLRGAVTTLAILVVASCATAPGASTGETPPADDTPLSQLQVLDDPRSYEGPSTARLVDREIEPVDEEPEQTLPVTVVSHDRAGDVEVVVEDTSRVIALDLAGSIAATVWGLGLGDSLVGRDGSTTFPGADDLPVVTEDGHSINAEAVLALDPTVVITDGSVGPRDVLEQLRSAGVTVIFLDKTSSFAGASAMARHVAAALGVPAAGEALAERIDADVTTTRSEIASFAPEGDGRLRMVFLYLRGSAGVYYIFGRESGASDLIEGLGGVDVASELGWNDLQPLTDEAIVAADPDLVLVMTGGIESTGGVDGLIEDRPAIALTAAGERRRFVDMADGDILSFGPRSAEVLAALARAVYAPQEAAS